MNYHWAFVICFPFILAAQPDIAYQNIYYSKIYSEFVEDTFHIYISLPAEYNITDQSYPVIYLLDADRSFGMTRDIIRWLNFSREIPSAILVGIAYQEDWWQKRSRDYTPYPDKLCIWGDWPLAGGASNFIAFIKNELDNKLDSLRINQTERSIIGHSLGGLFCLYVLFTNPDLFNNYLIISPAVLWNNYAVMEDTQILFNAKNPIKVFTALGSLEDQEKLVLPWNRLNEMMSQNNIHHVFWKSHLYEEQTHISVMPAAITDGLKFLFNR
jgi:uncharacterized protein